jgi:membrane associated rhomboid family serine protease
VSSHRRRDFPRAPGTITACAIGFALAFATVLGGTVLADADPKIIGAAPAAGAAGAVLGVVSIAIVLHAFETVSRRAASATVAGFIAG